MAIMATRQVESVLHHVRQVLVQHGARQQSDRELLQQFALRRDEQAFAELVRRHGLMVLAVCRRVLHDVHDAEDAFQAVFLILARKAKARGWRESVANWLYLVAYRLAMRLRKDRQRDRREMPQIQAMSVDPLEAVSGRELCAAVDEELSRMPERLRAGIVLCCLQGATRDEAARTLGWSLGTLKRRLEQGRALPRLRLQKRGFEPPAALTGALVATGTVVPAALACTVVQSALTGESASASVQASLNGMALTRLKIAATVLSLCAAVALGTGLALAPTPSGEKQVQSQKPAENRQPKTDGQQMKVDLHGDPLPEGAVARLGTVRFRHAGAVRAVAFSPDGKLLAASSDDKNMVVLWDRGSGRKLREILIADKNSPPNRLQFSPDGKRLYSSYWGRGASHYSWDVETGAEAKDLPRPFAESSAIGYSQDGREAILFQEGSDIVRWDTEKRKELGRYAKPEGDMSTAAWSGDRLLVPQFDGKAVRMWDAAQKKQLWSVETTRHQNYPGLPMTFSPDGKLFAVEAPPKVISVCESVTGKIIRRIEADVGKIYWSLSISPDARTVAGSNWDGTLWLWDLESGRERVKIPWVEGWCTHVFFSPDSRIFATGDGNNAHAVLLWDTATGKRIEPFPGHNSPVSSAAFSPDGRTVATSSWARGDPVIRIWDPQNGQLLRSFEGPDAGGVSAVAFSPDGKRLASCGWSGNKSVVRLWDVGSGRQLHALAGHEAGCTCLAFAPNGKRLASGDAYCNRMGHYEGRLCIWDVEGGKLVREIRGTRGAIRRVLFTCDGRQVLAAADGVHIYDAGTGKLVGEPLQPKTRVWGLSLSPDNRLLATSDGLSQAWLRDLTSHREIPLTVPGGNGRDVAFAPDGRIVAVSGLKGNVVLVDWLSEEVIGKLAVDTDVGAHVVFSADGRRLATAGDPDSSVLIWDVADKINRSLPVTAKASDADLRRWWKDMRNSNPGTAARAAWRFAAVPKQALPFLAESVRPIKAPEPEVVTRLIDDLDNDDFQVREKASRKLEQLGEAVEGDLRKAKEGTISLEQKRRIDALLKQLQGPEPNSEQLRAIRAVAVLEQIGGEEARKLLAGLAAGAQKARLTREAKAALERLARR
jgi:RNA polymerase sigma factor (sigma-70 family)